jgi:hypothetical protein
MTALPLARALAVIQSDTDWFAHRVHVDAVGHLARKVALEVLHETAGVLHVFESARQLTLRVGNGLAVLLGDDGGQLIGVLDKELAQGEQHVGALRQ